MTSKTSPDALELLDADHQAVRQLFAGYRELAAHDAPEARRKALAEQICMELWDPLESTCRHASLSIL